MKQKHPSSLSGKTFVIVGLKRRYSPVMRIFAERNIVCNMRLTSGNFNQVKLIIYPDVGPFRNFVMHVQKNWQNGIYCPQQIILV